MEDRNAIEDQASGLTNPGLPKPAVQATCNQWQPDHNYAHMQPMTPVPYGHHGSQVFYNPMGMQNPMGTAEGAAAYPAQDAPEGSMFPVFWTPAESHVWPLQTFPQLPTEPPPATTSIRINVQGNNALPKVTNNDQILQEFRSIGKDTPAHNPPRHPKPRATRHHRQKETPGGEEKTTSSSSVSRKRPKCVFCHRNGEEDVWHVFKDKKGRVLCPVLSNYKCRICGATGYFAHTLKYCPQNKITKGDPTAAGLPPGLMPSHIKYKDVI